MEKIKNTIKSEWDVISNAPWSVAAIVCVTAGAVWWFRGLLAKNRAETQNQHIKLLQDKLDGVSDPETAEKLDDMQRQIDERPIPQKLSFKQGRTGQPD